MCLMVKSRLTFEGAAMRLRRVGGSLLPFRFCQTTWEWPLATSAFHGLMTGWCKLPGWNTASATLVFWGGSYHPRIWWWHGNLTCGRDGGGGVASQRDPPIRIRCVDESCRARADTSWKNRWAALETER